jgi:hypothetical protein
MFQDQPLTLPFVRDGGAHHYTPDMAVRLADGRVFVIEVKPPELLGSSLVTLKLGALAKWCAERHVGFYAGSPARSILEHAATRPDPEAHRLLTALVDDGPLTQEDLREVGAQLGREQLGLVATHELLDWRPDKKLARAPGPDGTAIERFWIFIDRQLRDRGRPQAVAATEMAG